MSHEKALEAAELLPCPFCGGKAKYRPDHTVERIDTVSCLRCDFYLSDNGDIGSCVEAWNRRAPLSAIVPDEVAGVAMLRDVEACLDDATNWIVAIEGGDASPSNGLPAIRHQIDDARLYAKKLSALITALAARAETAERERDEARQERDENFADAKRASSEYHALAKENLANHRKAREAEAKLAEARKVIEPFAIEASQRPWLTGLYPEMDTWPIGGSALTNGDLRAARRFLEEAK